MNNSLSRRRVVAGLVRVMCQCCAEAQRLTTHPGLDETRLCCPHTGQTYLDRGDGVFEPDGGQIANQNANPAARGPAEPPEILSDRPTRTEAKSQIVLERATFAASAPVGSGPSRGGGR